MLTALSHSDGSHVNATQCSLHVLQMHALRSGLPSNVLHSTSYRVNSGLSSGHNMPRPLLVSSYTINSETETRSASHNDYAY